MFDLDEYLEEVRLLQEYVKLEAGECFQRFDFEPVGQRAAKSKIVLIFYNRRLGLQIELKFSKKGKVRLV